MENPRTRIEARTKWSYKKQIGGMGQWMKPMQEAEDGRSTTEFTGTILIVDDEPVGRATLKALLSAPTYRVIAACNGAEALQLAEECRPDLVLLDVIMPEMDGYEVCRRLRANAHLSEVPIIMITGLDDRASRLKGIEAGADDFISKPFDTAELQARVRSIIRLNRYRHLMEERARFERVVELSPDGLLIITGSGVIVFANRAMLDLLGYPLYQSKVIGRPLLDFVVDVPGKCYERCLQWVLADPDHVIRNETRFMRADGSVFPVEITGGYILWNGAPGIQLNVRDITERKRAQEEIERSRNELALAYDETLAGWVKAVDLRDKETEGHSQRVTEMTLRLARAMGVEGEALEHIRRGALLHDVGKMGIPDSILLKPGPLTDEEWELMRRHPIYAYEWLSGIAYLRPALDIPYCHHERWDGSGYPRGLRGEEIPLAARIFSVVDVWDALRSHRPYRTPWPEERIREYLLSLSGIHFDPKVVEVFLTIMEPTTSRVATR